jgi:porin
MMDGAPVEKPSDLAGWFSAKDGLLIMSEVALLSRPGEDTRPGAMRSVLGRLSSLPPYEDKIALGGWYYATSLDDLSAHGSSGFPVVHRGSAGAYVLLDKRLFEDGDAFLSGFVQAGLGDDRVEHIGSYVSLGVVANGFIFGRPNDQMGIALAKANNGSHFLKTSQASFGGETAAELTYVYRATDWLAVQPDAQYVWHPGSAPGLRDALVFQLEFETSF